MEADFDRKLVSYVERYPVLYDPRDPAYGDRERTRTTWQEIAENMESSECVVRGRWKDLRRSFGKAYREFATLAPTCTRHPRSCIAFPFFESMLWLAPYLRKRRSCSSSLKIRKCPVHGFIGEQISRTCQKVKGSEVTKIEKRQESISSGTSCQSSSSYFTEASHGQSVCKPNGTEYNGTQVQNGRNHQQVKENNHKTCSAKNHKKRNDKGIYGNHSDEYNNKHPNDDLNRKQKDIDIAQKEEDKQHSNNSIDKQVNPLSWQTRKKSECTQTEQIFNEKDVGENSFMATNGICQGFLNADMNFMISVISDMQLIPHKKRITFKREVMQLLEKYAINETD